MLETTVPLYHSLWTTRFTHYRYTTPNREPETLLCTSLHPCEMTPAVHYRHLQNTNSKEAGKWDLIPLAFGTREHPIVPTVNLQTAFIYRLEENRNNSASQN